MKNQEKKLVTMPFCKKKPNLREKTRKPLGLKGPSPHFNEIHIVVPNHLRLIVDSRLVDLDVRSVDHWIQRCPGLEVVGLLVGRRCCRACVRRTSGIGCGVGNGGDRSYFPGVGNGIGGRIRKIGIVGLVVGLVLVGRSLAMGCYRWTYHRLRRDFVGIVEGVVAAVGVGRSSPFPRYRIQIGPD